MNTLNQLPNFINPLTLPLRGEILIEASAGTGKTFTIVLLYLRFLLGLGGENAYHRPLSVNEILVVTFTESATSELRERIHENIHDLRLACKCGFSDNEMLNRLLKDILNPEDAISLLLVAESQIDESSIFTIHSFCQRMLNMHAFECDMLFEQKIIEDEKKLFKQAIKDFWRIYFYPLTLDIAKIIINEWHGPEALLDMLSPLLQRDLTSLNMRINENETLISRHQHNIDLINKIKIIWLKVDENLIKLIISESGIDKHIYNNKYLSLWINKISLWAKIKTINYDVPSELSRFGQTILKKKTKIGCLVPYHTLFIAIDDFLSQKISLRDLVIYKALEYIKKAVQKEKHLRGLLSFNDLLSNLDTALQHKKNKLAQVIRQRFPVALIDEFQDTDPQQYRIFSTLYINQPKHALLLIGDPKQSIYAFRGADIFTYIQARNAVKLHYTLDTNWRSSPNMVNSINYVFSQIKNPFIFKEIPFLPVNYAPKNHNLTMHLDNQTQTALRFYLQPGSGHSINDYKKYMAQQCAASISKWLYYGQQGRLLLGQDQKQRPIRASDITILVRNRNEAHIIRDELKKLNIPSTYLSNSDSVYSTIEAREVLWLLQAILTPEQEHKLKTALATSLFSFDSAQIDYLYNKTNILDKMINTFLRWQLLWQQRGILPMLRNLMIERHLAENLLVSKNGKSRLTNFLYLGELLQEISFKFNNPHALVRYLTQQINNPEIQISKQHSYLESELDLIQIVTIHKSKGLQYPLVWLPFIAGFRELKDKEFYSFMNSNKIIDLHNNEDTFTLDAQQLRLAEDLRLLYVALTRSIYHCSVGISAIFLGTRKKEGESDLHHSALGYLLQQGKAATAKQLEFILRKMRNEICIDIVVNNIINLNYLNKQPVKNIHLNARKVTRQLTDNWHITSYTELQKNNNRIIDNVIDYNIDYIKEKKIIECKDETLLTPHHFPRGISAGNFLHKFFESLNFTEYPSKESTARILQDNDYPLYWKFMIQKLALDVINIPLNKDGMTLSIIPSQDKITEMVFYLPINNFLRAKEINSILRINDTVSAKAPLLDFNKVKGMLKGLIDLVFRWRDKYYLLDYKSNWLGDNNNAYTESKILHTMIKHRYDLQYQLYTLAIHRYLKHRLAPYYDYDKYFGGVFYLFLRGIDKNISANNGVFYTRPEKNFILKLDRIFDVHE